MYLFDHKSMKVSSKNLATSKCPSCLAVKIILSLLLLPIVFLYLYRRNRTGVGMVATKYFTISKWPIDTAWYIGLHQGLHFWILSWLEAIDMSVMHSEREMS